MARIAIFHPTIMLGGGGEGVCAHILEALVPNHKVTLFTTDRVNIEVFNEFHGTDIDRSSITVKNPLPKLSKLIDKAAIGVSRLLPDTNFGLLKHSLAQRRLDSISDDFDIIFSTWNEIFCDSQSLQYIHFPGYHPNVYQEFDPRSKNRKYRIYHDLCRLLIGSNVDFGESTTTMANSQWTAELVRENYDTDVSVVYPPVDVAKFEPNSWDRKEPGFVSIGRIHPLKRQLFMINVFDKLIEKGYDTHLHIVGGVGDKEYQQKVKHAADSREYVSMEGRLARSDLIDIVERHKYGIHSKKFEHFGMVVAELAAGGAIPFVHASGGQTEIVNGSSELTYNSIDSAVKNITRVLNDQELQERLHTQMNSTAKKFDKSEFQNQIQTIVSRTT